MRRLVSVLACVAALAVTSPAEAYATHQSTYRDKAGDAVAFFGGTQANRVAADIRTVTYQATSRALTVTIRTGRVSMADYVYDMEADVGLYSRTGRYLHTIDVLYGPGSSPEIWTTDENHKHVCATGVRGSYSQTANTISVRIAKGCLAQRTVKMKALVLFHAADAHGDGYAGDEISPKRYFFSFR